MASGDGSPGSLLVYQLALSNGGTREAAEVALRETVPQLTSFRAAGSSPGWTCTPDGNAGSACTLGIGTVAAGASATYTFAVQVAGSFPPNPPAIDNSACVSTTSTGDPSDNDCGSVSTPPGGNPDLVITKNLTSGTVGPNEVLVFTLSLRNQGNREATGVVLRETVSENSVFEPAGSSPDWNCTPDGNAGASCALHVGVVEAGASSSFAFAVRLRADLPTDARISNTACAEQPARANDPAGNDCFTLVVDPPAAEPRTDLELALGVDGSPQRTGDPFTFTLTVRNASTVAADGLRIAVSLPSFGTEPTELDPACHRSGGGAVLECSVSHLAGSASVSFSWKQFARQAGAYTVAAELIEATPDDVDSVPGNGAAQRRRLCRGQRLGLRWAGAARDSYAVLGWHLRHGLVAGGAGRCLPQAASSARRALAQEFRVGRLEARCPTSCFPVTVGRSKSQGPPSDFPGRRQPGRPRKPPSQRRSRVMRVRFSEADLDSLQQLADGQPLSTYLRQAALGRPARTRIPSANREITGHLARIGNNLNQLVRLAHTGRYPMQFESVLRQLYEKLAEVQRQLMEGGPR